MQRAGTWDLDQGGGDRAVSLANLAGMAGVTAALRAVYPLHPG